MIYLQIYLKIPSVTTRSHQHEKEAVSDQIQKAFWRLKQLLVGQHSLQVRYWETVTLAPWGTGFGAESTWMCQDHIDQVFSIFLSWQSSDPHNLTLPWVTLHTWYYLPLATYWGILNQVRVVLKNKLSCGSNKHQKSRKHTEKQILKNLFESQLFSMNCWCTQLEFPHKLQKILFCDSRPSFRLNSCLCGKGWPFHLLLREIYFL